MIPRLSVFLKEPGQKNILFEVDNNEGTEVFMEEPYPGITNSDSERGYVTGYVVRKGGSFNRKYYANGGGYTAAVVFRATEALLNYMEASYLLNGNLDATAQNYWKALRRRAGVDEDFNKTIALTDMSKEAENDWGAYTAGKLVDKTLYNIRRERRCEFYGRRSPLYGLASLACDGPIDGEPIPYRRYALVEYADGGMVHWKGRQVNLDWRWF